MQWTFRGGCAVVWIAEDTVNGGTVAIKQFPKGSDFKQKSDIETAKKEVEIHKKIFSTDEATGKPNIDSEKFPGKI